MLKARKSELMGNATDLSSTLGVRSNSGAVVNSGERDGNGRTSDPDVVASETRTAM